MSLFVHTHAHALDCVACIRLFIFPLWWEGIWWRAAWVRDGARQGGGVEASVAGLVGLVVVGAGWWCVCVC